MRKPIFLALVLVIAVSATAVRADTCGDCVQRELSKAAATPRAIVSGVGWGVLALGCTVMSGGTALVVVGCTAFTGLGAGGLSYADNYIAARAACANECRPTPALPTPTPSPAASVPPLYQGGPQTSFDPQAFGPGSFIPIPPPSGGVVYGPGGSGGTHVGGTHVGSSSGSGKATDTKKKPKHAKQQKQAKPQKHVKQAQLQVRQDRRQVRQQVRLQSRVCPPNARRCR